MQDFLDQFGKSTPLINTRVEVWAQIYLFLPQKPRRIQDVRWIEHQTALNRSDVFCSIELRSVVLGLRFEMEEVNGETFHLKTRAENMLLS
jgi:hypothetical protein